MRATPIVALLDTHVLLWWLEGKKHLSKRQQRIIDKASAERPLFVSDITLWEIATLSELGRIKLGTPLREWLEQATALPLVQRHPISPAVAAQVAALPSTLHRDPADRIIIATAIVLSATILTRDERIIDAGLAPTVE